MEFNIKRLKRNLKKSGINQAQITRQPWVEPYPEHA